MVVGYLLLVSMGRLWIIGERLYDGFCITFAFSWRCVVLAAAVMSFPGERCGNSSGAGKG
ncbi:hypothetical protein ACNKHL_03165 [Shigella flexneri]